jgi:hypothetical protein
MGVGAAVVHVDWLALDSMWVAPTVPFSENFNLITHFRLSWWLLVDLNSIHRLLHYVNVGDVVSMYI